MKRYIYYVDVGQLPKAKAEEYVEKIRNNFQEWWPRKDEWLFLPLRENLPDERIKVMEVDE